MLEVLLLISGAHVRPHISLLKLVEVREMVLLKQGMAFWVYPMVQHSSGGGVPPHLHTPTKV